MHLLSYIKSIFLSNMQMYAWKNVWFNDLFNDEKKVIDIFLTGGY